MKNLLSFVLAASFLILAVSCEKECCVTNPCTKNCNLIPNVGPCNAAIIKYHFNTQTMQCDSFIWGGCAGVVPYQTLKDCQNCGCK
jgi:hypothetical protein